MLIEARVTDLGDVAFVLLLTNVEKSDLVLAWNSFLIGSPLGSTPEVHLKLTVADCVELIFVNVGAEGTLFVTENRSYDSEHAGLGVLLSQLCMHQL